MKQYLKIKKVGIPIFYKINSQIFHLILGTLGTLGHFRGHLQF